MNNVSRVIFCLRIPVSAISEALTVLTVNTVLNHWNGLLIDDNVILLQGNYNAGGLSEYGIGYGFTNSNRNSSLIAISIRQVKICRCSLSPCDQSWFLILLSDQNIYRNSRRNIGVRRYVGINVYGLMAKDNVVLVSTDNPYNIHPGPISSTIEFRRDLNISVIPSDIINGNRLTAHGTATIYPVSSESNIIKPFLTIHIERSVRHGACGDLIAFTIIKDGVVFVIQVKSCYIRIGWNILYPVFRVSYLRAGNDIIPVVYQEVFTISKANLRRDITAGLDTSVNRTHKLNPGP